MAKKGSRLREFEKNNRVLDITNTQQERQKKKSTGKKVKTGNPSEQGKKPLNLVKLVGIGVSLVFVMVVAISIKNIYDLKVRESALLDKHQELLKIEETLKLELENVNSDAYIEEQARKELKLIKGNELIFHFSDEPMKKDSKKDD
ncbi:MAG: hypothetical protein HFE73_10125 [Firmicutes bacterium]|nr:hypothetical protein [Bacillota bacterium]